MGRLSPARPGIAVRILRGRQPVAWDLVRPGVTFPIPIRLARPGPSRARAAGALSPPVAVRLRPRLEARLLHRPDRSGLVLVSRLRPRYAGRVRVEIARSVGRPFARTFAGDVDVLLSSSTERVTVTLKVLPRPGYTPFIRQLHIGAQYPRLSLGSRGQAVRELLRRLSALGYAAPAPRTSFDGEVLSISRWLTGSRKRGRRGRGLSSRSQKALSAMPLRGRSWAFWKA
ncbi:MAG: hypothetical protein C4306_11825 [Thermoleophilia bacterium]